MDIEGGMEGGGDCNLFAAGTIAAGQVGIFAIPIALAGVSVARMLLRRLRGE